MGFFSRWRANRIRLEWVRSIVQNQHPHVDLNYSNVFAQIHWIMTEDDDEIIHEWKRNQ